MNILMIAPTSFFSDYGGHIRIYEETLALQKRGHTVTIVTYYKGRDLPGLDIQRTAALPYRTDYEVGSSRHKLAFDAYLAVKAWRVARKMRPDIIHAHMHEGALIGAVLAKRLRVPLVFDFQGSLSAEMADHNFVKPQGIIYHAIRWLEAQINLAPDTVLTSSTRAKEQLHTQFSLPRPNVVALPDCVDMERFDPRQFDPAVQQQLRHELGIPDGRIVIGYLGLLTEYQGIHHLLHAAVRLKEWGKNAHFLIMGYPNVEKFQAMADAMGVGDVVTLPGRIQYDRAPLYLSLADITVSAKMSATEGSGKVLNYMALAKPIVAYDNPVHREYLGEWGIYPPSADQDRLAIELARLVDSPERCARLGQKLQERARQAYSWNKAAGEIAAVYVRLLTAKGVSVNQ